MKDLIEAAIVLVIAFFIWGYKNNSPEQKNYINQWDKKIVKIEKQEQEKRAKEQEIKKQEQEKRAKEQEIKKQEQERREQEIVNNIKILNHGPCFINRGNIMYKELCGIVENNNSENMDVTLEYDLYDNNGIKIKHSYIFLSIDANGGKTKFNEYLFGQDFDTYKLKVSSVRKD